MSRRVPVEEAATVVQVEAAIAALTAADNARIVLYARRLVKGLGSTSRGRDHKDLMQDEVPETGLVWSG